MAYEKTVWVNGQAPALDAEHLNKIEQGIANSAPSGFGLGSDTGYTITATDDLDTIIKNGVYQWGDYLPKNAPTRYCKMRVWCGAGWASQETMSAYASEKDSIRRRVFNNGAWGPWDWVNPPMLLDVEYRTTERYLGKPVYTIIHQFDDLKVSQVYTPGGQIIRFSGESQWPLDDSGRWIPQLPSKAPNAPITDDLPHADFGVHYNNSIRILLKADSESLGKSARVQLWYTK